MREEKLAEGGKKTSGAPFGPHAAKVSIAGKRLNASGENGKTRAGEEAI